MTLKLNLKMAPTYFAIVFLHSLIIMARVGSTSDVRMASKYLDSHSSDSLASNGGHSLGYVEDLASARHRRMVQPQEEGLEDLEVADSQHYPVRLMILENRGF